MEVTEETVRRYAVRSLLAVIICALFIVGGATATGSQVHPGVQHTAVDTESATSQSEVTYLSNGPQTNVTYDNILSANSVNVDTFEDKDLDEYSDVEAAEVTSNTAYNGSAAVVITDENEEMFRQNGHYTGNRIYREGAPSAPSHLSAAVRADDGYWNDVRVRWLNSSGSPIHTIDLDNIGSEHDLKYGGNRIRGFNTYTWYDIELRNIDWSANTVGEIVVNGQSTATDVPFANPGDSISNVTMSVNDGGTGSQGWFDNISIPSADTNQSYTYHVPFSRNEPGSYVDGGQFHSNLRVQATANDTTVRIDADADGEFENTTSLNATETYGVSKPSKGATIRASDRIAVRYAHGGNSWGAYEDTMYAYGLPPERLLGQEYTLPLPADRLWLTAPTESTVEIDSDGDGTTDRTTTIAANEVVRVDDPARGATISASDAVHVVAEREKFSNLGSTYLTTLLPNSEARTDYTLPAEHDYNLQNPESQTGVYLAATEDDTTVDVTVNNTVHAERRLDAGETSFIGVTATASVKASAPVVATYVFDVESTSWWESTRRTYTAALTPVPEMQVAGSGWSGKDFDGGIDGWSSYQTEPSQENASPVANFTWAPTEPEVGTTVTFDASASSDPDGTIEHTRWDIAGDSRSGSSGEVTEHTFNSAGTYDVTLTVTDDSGENASITKTITVNRGWEATLRVEDSNTSYTGNSPVVVAPNLVINGENDTTFGSARVSIGTGFASGTDMLGFDSDLAGSLGIAGSYDTDRGVLIFNGTGTITEYEDLLRTVTYNSTAATPTTTPRNITFSIGSRGQFNPDTGHYYEFVQASSITWQEAREAASERMYNGHRGYLATVTSASENDLVKDKLQGKGWIGASDHFEEGTWRWVTGPEGQEADGIGQHFFTQTSSRYGDEYNGATYGGGHAVNDSYQNWHRGDIGATEPNNKNGEDYAHYYEDGTWNDYQYNNSNIDGYIVEYGGLDTETNITASDTKTVTIGQEETSITAQNAVAVTGDTAYVISDGDILEVNLTTRDTVDSFAAPDGTNRGLAYGNGSLWYADGATSPYDGEILELDPDTGVIRSQINTYYDPYGLAYGNGSLWAGEVTGIPNTVREFAPNGTNVGTFDISGPAGSTGPNGLAYFNGSIWVGTNNALYRLGMDGSLQAEFTRDVGYKGLAGSPTALYGPDENGELTVLREKNTSDSSLNAALEYTPESPRPGQELTFNATESAAPEGSIVSYDWDFDGDNTTDATGETVTHTFDSTGEYLVSLTVTDDTGATDTTTQTVTVNQRNGSSGVTVAAEPREASVLPQHTTTLRINASQIDAGVGSYNLTVATNDTSVAEVTLARPKGNPLRGGDTSVTSDGSAVHIEGAATDTADSGEVTIATVELETGRPGTARIAVNVASLSDENGSTYTGVSEEHATLTVGQLRGPPAIVDDKRPTDTDGDGVFEDVNGNGDFDVGDVTALWAHRNNDNVTSNPQAFDMNGDGGFGVNDITALWSDYLAS